MLSLDPVSAALPLDPGQALAEHGAWMSRLVRGLVRDADRVDDVAQDAWAAALQNPAPEGVPLRAWLAGIVKRTAMARGRSDKRRRERETRVATEGAREGGGAGRSDVRDVAELSACAEEQRFLLDALNELPEGEKDVLLLRFYGDEPPREIARQLGIPVNTVRSRQRLGLQRLRERLDQRHGGDSSAWATVLLPLSRLGAGSAAKAAVASTGWLAKAGAVMAAVLLAGGGVVLWIKAHGGPVEPADRMVRVSALEAASVFGAPAAGSGATGPAAGPATGPADTPAGGGRSAAASPRPLGTTVVNLRGEPIAGAKVFRVATPSPKVVTGGINPESRVPDAVTDEAGRFALAPRDAGDDVAWVWVYHPGYFHRVAAQRISPEDGQSIELVPTRMATLEVRVADPTSAMEATAFSVSVLQERDRIAEGFPISFSSSTSRKTFDGVVRMEVRYAVDRPLRVTVSDVAGRQGARDPGDDANASRAHEQYITPRTGEVSAVRFELELDEPETSGAYPVARARVLDRETGEAIVGALVSGAVILETPPPAAPDWLPEGSTWTPAPRHRVVATGQDGSFAIALPRDSASTSRPTEIRIAHPEYAAGTFDMLPDASGDLRLARRGALTVRVVDREGEPMENAAVGVEAWSGPSPWDGPARSDRPKRWRALTDANGEVLVPRMTGGRFRVMVLRRLKGSDDGALAQSSVTLEPAESRTVTMKVSPPNLVRVTGRYLDDASNRGPTMFFSYSDEGGYVEAKETRTGFDAGGLARGRYLVAFTERVDGRDDGRLVSFLPGVVIDGVAEQSLDLRPGASVVTGRFARGAFDVPEGAALRLHVTPVGVAGFAADVLENVAAEGKHWTAIDPASGAFEAKGLVDGEHRFEVRRADTGDVVTTRTVAVSGRLELGTWK